MPVTEQTGTGSPCSGRPPGAVVGLAGPLVDPGGRYDLLFKRNPQPMWVHDNDTLAFLEVNDSATQEYGYSREEFLRMTIPDILAGEDVLADAYGLASGVQKPTCAGSQRHRRRDGTTFDVEVTCQELTYVGRPARLVLVRDVTARLDAERALEERATFLTAFIENNPLALVATDTLACVRFCNAAFERLFGYAQAGIIGRELDPLIVPPELEAEERRLRTAAEMGSPVSATTVRRRLDGALVDVEMQYVPLVVRGEVAGGISIYQDVTERKKAGEALVLSQARYRELFEECPVALWLEDFSRVKQSIDSLKAAGVADLRDYLEANPEEVVRLVSEAVVLDVNHAAIRMQGAPDKAYLLRGLQQAFTDGSYDAFLLEILAVAEGRTWHESDNVTRTWQGERMSLIVRWSVLPGCEKDYSRLLVSVSDITERRRAEVALRHSEANYRSLVENAPYGIYRVTPEGKFLDVNPAFVEMLGYSSKEEVLALDAGRDVFVDDNERQELVEQRLRESATSPRFESIELHWKRKDGTPLIVRTSGRSVVNASGQVECFEVMAVNITRQRMLEEHMRQVAKMEAVGRLAGGVAHDFNNLLNVVGGYSELLCDQLEGGDPRRRMATEIHRAAGRATGLTKQLLAFSRQQVFQPEVLDLNTVLLEVEEMLRRLIGEDIDLIVRTSSQLGKIKVDPNQLEQVILNLAVNARDAISNGGRLELETNNAVLNGAHVRKYPYVQPGNYVVLTVKDNGKGMDENTLAHIFEPFFTTKEKGKGTGLGLATVYGVVRQSGGYIWASSEPGLGSTFQVYFPRVEEEAGIVKGPALAAAKCEGNPQETILVVEDEEGVRQLTREILEAQGYRVLDACDGREALQVCAEKSGEVDLVITDVVMPGMGGRALADQVRARWPGIRVLYMSGYADSLLAPRGLLEEGIVLLPKPFSRANLTRLVREMLDGTVGRRATSEARTLPAKGESQALAAGACDGFSQEGNFTND